MESCNKSYPITHTPKPLNLKCETIFYFNQMTCNYLDACAFFLSLVDPLEFVESVESFLANDSASCTPYLTNDNGFIATLQK